MPAHPESLAGTGTPTWQGKPVEGVVVEVKTPDDVLGLLDAELDDKIILMHTAGATMLAPLFAELKGIICTTGGIGSHVAILSREFGVPCLLTVELTESIADRRVRIESTGTSGSSKGDRLRARARHAGIGGSTGSTSPMVCSKTRNLPGPAARSKRSSALRSNGLISRRATSS